MDLFGLELVGVIGAADFGGIHLESLSHLSSFLAGLAALAGATGDVGCFGGFIHLEVSVDVDVSDGHCHDDGGGGGGAGTLQFDSLDDLGVGVGVVAAGLRGFKATLFGQLSFKFGGRLDLYFGVAVVVVSDELFDSLLSAGSVHRTGSG